MKWKRGTAHSHSSFYLVTRRLHTAKPQHDRTLLDNKGGVATPSSLDCSFPFPSVLPPFTSTCHVGQCYDRNCELCCV